jgi:hypothetical protein
MALEAISAGLGIASSIGGFFGARSARKKQQRMIKKMMADRAKRIKAAKGQVQKSRRGLMAENRAAMNAAIAGAPQALGASLQRGSTSANYLRSIYADAQRRANEIGRQTAAQMSELEMMSPYDIVDPSSMGAGKGAETQALLGGLSQLAGAFGEGGAFSGMFGGGAPTDPYGGGMTVGAGGELFKTGVDPTTGSYASMPVDGSLGNKSMAFPG